MEFFFKQPMMRVAGLLFALLLISLPLQADDHNGNSGHETSESHQHEEGPFDPGEFIFDHIGDAHEWHIISLGEKHIAIPLPIIIYSKHSGFHVFMSSKFHHGESYQGFTLPTEGEHKGKIVETVNGLERLPLDFSITKNVLALFLSLIFLTWLFLGIAKTYKKRKDEAPRGIQGAFEPLIIFIRDEVAKPAIGKKKYERFMPFLLTVFFFILFNNLLGLIPIFPGGANVTGNIAVTATLALLTFVITTFSANKNYWKHIFNTPGVPWWLKFPIPLMPIIELLGMFTKPFVLMVRLFANISAGHIIALGFFSLIFIFGDMIGPGAGFGVSPLSIVFTIFMSMLEFLVAFIQAYVFTLLSAIYFGMATEEHH